MSINIIKKTDCPVPLEICRYTTKTGSSHLSRGHVVHCFDSDMISYVPLQIWEEETHEVPKSPEARDASFFATLHEFRIPDVVRSDEYNWVLMVKLCLSRNKLQRHTFRSEGIKRLFENLHWVRSSPKKICMRKSCSIADNSPINIPSCLTVPQEVPGEDCKQTSKPQSVGHAYRSGGMCR